MGAKQMTEHFFFKRVDTDTFMVRCGETLGSFCTSIWKLGKERQGICPCCGKEVKK